jgi:DNA-binding MarR family transcriptional regulator
VRREAHPDDRRKLLVDITDKARLMLDEMLPTVHASAVEMVEGIGEVDREHLIQLLAQIGANIQAMSERPVPKIKLRRRAVRPQSKSPRRPR